MAQNDYQMALLLQQQFQHEAAIESPTNNLVYAKKRSKSAPGNTKSLVDPSWELVDPTPDIHILFIAFNEKYFWNKLLAVCVDWSKRMTSCAGVCSYQGRGGMCRITLSEPLLKLRPRKDLIETLLHEMIHAFLFVTNNNRDRDGHGPEFHKHMHRINDEAGTNITVYHDFHDEVRLYKQHWWRCNGPCQTRKPYFGMVRRATNRAPGPNDFWWAEHQLTCGGAFIKVQEPPKSGSNKKPGKDNKPSSNPTKDIRSFYPVVQNKSPSSTNINQPTGSSNSIPSSNKPGSSSTTNIKGFKDLTATRPTNVRSNSTSTIVVTKKPTTTKQDPKQEETPKSNEVQPPKSTPIIAFTGTGRALGNPASGSPDYEAVRNHWANKFPAKRPSSASSVVSEGPKRLKPNEDVTCPVCQRKFPSSEVNAHLDRCLSEEGDAPHAQNKSNCPVCDQEFEVEVINGHVEACLSNVFVDSEEPTEGVVKAPQDLIPCLVCNKRIPREDLNVHLDDCMGGDNIFSNSSGNINPDEDGNDGKPASEDKDKKYNCPVCFELFSVGAMTEHLDKCLSSDDEASNSFLEDPF